MDLTSPVRSGRTRGNGRKLHQGIGYHKIFLQQKGCQALEESVQESGWATIPGNYLKDSRCGSWEHGLVENLAVMR